MISMHSWPIILVSSDLVSFNPRWHGQPTLGAVQHWCLANVKGERSYSFSPVRSAPTALPSERFDRAESLESRLSSACPDLLSASRVHLSRSGGFPAPYRCLASAGRTSRSSLPSLTDQCCSVWLAVLPHRSRSAWMQRPVRQPGALSRHLDAPLPSWESSSHEIPW